MGRDSGFIAMHATLASGQIDICLIPEVYMIKIGQNTLSLSYWYTDASSCCGSKVPFNLHGPRGVLSYLKYLIETKGSAVVCVAERGWQMI